jgi:hypothetical protein
MEVFTRNIETMDFKGFGGSLYAFRLFSKYSSEVPGKLSLTEF